jgi:hypothetical protein
MVVKDIPTVLLHLCYVHSGVTLFSMTYNKYKSTMRQFVKLLSIAALGLVAFTTTNAVAQSNGHQDPGCVGCSGELDGYVRVIRPVCVTMLTDMNFGALYSGSGGTATITPNNSSTAQNNSLRSTSGVSGVGFSGPNSSANNDIHNHGVQQGQVRVDGEAGFSYNLSVGSSTWSSGANNIAVSNVTFASQGGAFSFPNGVLSGTISSGGAGTQNLNVGATLTLAANQAPGMYHGVIPITAAYN